VVLGSPWTALIHIVTCVPATSLDENVDRLPHIRARVVAVIFSVLSFSSSLSASSSSPSSPSFL
jgi:hypothetical protein